MRTRKKLVEGGSCCLSWISNMCSASIPFIASNTQCKAIKLPITESLVPKSPVSFRLVVFKHCHVISPCSKIHKQDNTKITPPKDPMAGVLECEFWFIKYRCLAGYDFFLTLAYWFVLALLAFNNLLAISRRPVQISKCVCRENPFMKPLTKVW